MNRKLLNNVNRDLVTGSWGIFLVVIFCFFFSLFEKNIFFVSWTNLSRKNRYINFAQTSLKYHERSYFMVLVKI